MCSIDIQTIVLFVLFCSAAKAVKLRECGEFDQKEIFARAEEILSRPMEFQDELESIFDAYENNDTVGMEKIFKSLENKTFTESEDAPTSFSKKIIKYVVSLSLV